MTDVQNVDEQDLDIEQTFSDEYERLTIQSDFVFGKVMQDEKLALKLLQRIFPDRDIERVKVVEAQKTERTSHDSHGIRLDVYIKSVDGTAFTVEMQVEDTKELPKRSRYYQSTMDNELLGKGIFYKYLPDSFVVFICPFDPFTKNRRIYTFKSICAEETDLELNDGATKVFLNAVGTRDEVSPELQNFLDYVMGKMPENDDFIKETDAAVQKARMNKEWRREYMTLLQRDLEKIDEGRQEGRLDGILEANGNTVSTITDLQRQGVSAEDIVKKLLADLNVKDHHA